MGMTLQVLKDIIFQIWPDDQDHSEAPEMNGHSLVSTTQIRKDSSYQTVSLSDYVTEYELHYSSHDIS